MGSIVQTIHFIMDQYRTRTDIADVRSQNSTIELMTLNYWSISDSNR